MFGTPVYSCDVYYRGRVVGAGTVTLGALEPKVYADAPIWQYAGLLYVFNEHKYIHEVYWDKDLGCYMEAY